ncbi:MAG: hypothetical protein HY261_03650 [Chloroflexi bacterium]|nr:hypothetical protein [Chloroflexota bacterium]
MSRRSKRMAARQADLARHKKRFGSRPPMGTPAAPPETATAPDVDGAMASTATNVTATPQPMATPQAAPPRRGPLELQLPRRGAPQPQAAQSGTPQRFGQRQMAPTVAARRAMASMPYVKSDLRSIIVLSVVLAIALTVLAVLVK